MPLFKLCYEKLFIEQTIHVQWGQIIDNETLELFSLSGIDLRSAFCWETFSFHNNSCVERNNIKFDVSLRVFYVGSEEESFGE